MPHSQKTQNINQSNIVTNSIKDKQNKKTHTHSENKIGGFEDNCKSGCYSSYLNSWHRTSQQDISCLSKQEGLNQFLTVYDSSR